MADQGRAAFTQSQLNAKQIGDLSTSVNSKANQSDLDLYGNQEDFIKPLKRHTKVNDTFAISCASVDKSEFSIVYDFPDGKSLEYNTTRSSIDGYTPICEGKVGTSVMNSTRTNRKDYDSKTGTWVTTSAPNIYTTEVGATLTINFFGSGLDFNFLGDNRGGIWEFVVNGDTANKITISTFRSSSTNSFVPVFRNTENKQLNVVATFKGDDPANPPSSGVGTSRGWSYGMAAAGETTKLTFSTYKVIKQVNAAATPLYGPSNKEFAISIRKSGTTNPYHFTPLHDVATAVPIEPMKIIVDGVEKTFSVGDSFLNVKEVKFVQKIYSKNPESTENLAKITTVTTFKNDGTIEVDGRFEALINLDIDRGYGIMFPIGNVFSDYLLTSVGSKYETNRSDGFEQYLNTEKDKTSSFLSLSTTNKNIGVACTFNNAKETLRWNKLGKRSPDTLRVYLQHRDANMAKLYQVCYYNASVNAGEVFRFSGTFYIGYFEGLYDLFL